MYIPLHQKYRPQTLAQLVGQEAIATTLTNAIRLSKIAPAYLFTGCRGTGKTSTARILAKSLNCLAFDVPTEQPCLNCDVCKAIASGNAIDVIEIDAASNTGVDNVRELIEKAQFAPVACRRKVFIIDEVHCLSSASFNALLKTLEEPPHRVVFVLATTEPHKVLPTIISRCQRFDFRRIPIHAIVKHLRAIANIETINITEDALTLIAQLAVGGLRDAECLLDQLSLLPKVTVEEVWDLVGAVPQQELLTLMQAIASSKQEVVLEKIHQQLDRGREPLAIAQGLAGLYRDLLLAKTAPERSDLAILPDSIWNALVVEAARWEFDRITRSQEYLKESVTLLKNTTQPQLWLEITLLGLMPTVQKVPVGLVATTTPSTEAATTTTTEKKEIYTSPQLAPSTKVATATAQSDIWQQTLTQLPAAARALLQQHGQLVSFEGSNATIRMRSEALKARVPLEQLRTALSKVAGTTTTVTLTC